MLTVSSVTSAVANPRSVIRSVSIFRRKSPAETNSTRQKITCAERNTDRSGSRRRCVVRVRVACNAGIRPNNRQLTIASPSVKPTTVASVEKGSANWSVVRVRMTSGGTKRAISSAGTPAISANIRLSVISWRTSRPRDAPSDRRMRISRSREAARASNRLATLAQASSSTTSTPPPISRNTGSTSRVTFTPADPISVKG
jgi:hypothetical protein